MSITLDAVSFDEAHTSVREKQEEVGGRNVREIILSGAIVGENSVAAIEAKLDAILDAASVEDYSAALSLRAGRRLLVRRNKFTREIARESLVGTFQLELEAKEPFEESVATTLVDWIITASGQTRFVFPVGNVFSWPVIKIAATGAIVNPAFSDSLRAITYLGTVNDGEVLTFDAVAGTTSLAGTDVTPYTTGQFPQLFPGGTTLTYTDDATSSHTAATSITHRDRWW